MPNRATGSEKPASFFLRLVFNSRHPSAQLAIVREHSSCSQRLYSPILSGTADANTLSLTQRLTVLRLLVDEPNDASNKAVALRAVPTILKLTVE